MSDGLILIMLVSLALSLMAYKLQSLPIMFISSIGWSIAALNTFQELDETVPMILLLMLAFSQFFAVRRESKI